MTCPHPIPVIYGLWHGGSSYSEPYLDTDLEIFLGLTDARDVLEDRARNGHWQRQTFAYADGRTENTFTPNADSGARIVIYLEDPRDVTDPCPDLELVLNEDGTITEENR